MKLKEKFEKHIQNTLGLDIVFICTGIALLIISIITYVRFDLEVIELLGSIFSSITILFVGIIFNVILGKDEKK